MYMYQVLTRYLYFIGSRRASKNLVRINLPSTAGELLIQPGSIDIFTCNVIPSISKFGKHKYLVNCVWKLPVNRSIQFHFVNLYIKFKFCYCLYIPLFILFKLFSDVPCETHDGVKIAVKLPDGNRLCRR